MSPLNFTHILTQTVDELSESESYKGLFHQHKDGEPLPSPRVLCDVIELARSILFPGYYGNSTVNSRTINYHIGVNVEKLFNLLTEQILAGLCFGNGDQCNECTESKREEAARLAAKFISKLPHLRRVLATDVEAAYNGDPAAQSFGEVIFCYPAIKAISNYRIAHELLELGVPLIPRIITEMAHSETGIDIHPGARSFPLDADGKPIKGIPRHPILEDNVIVYSNATILGRITIGRDATVGGNIWVTENIPAGARIVQTKAKK